MIEDCGFRKQFLNLVFTNIFWKLYEWQNQRDDTSRQSIGKGRKVFLIRMSLSGETMMPR